MFMPSPMQPTIDHAADHVVSLLLQAVELAGESSTWLQGKTLGIIGRNALSDVIKQRAAYRFGMNILLSDPSDRTTAPLTAMLPEADVVFLNAPDLPENRGLLNAVRLDQMKPTALLIAFQSGGLIDAQALCQALEFETITAAAFDSDGLISIDRIQLTMCDNVSFASMPKKRTPHLSLVKTSVPSETSRDVVQAA